IGLLILITLTVAVVASLGGGLYIGSLIRPLWKLTNAAQQMGQGDLSTPITNPAKTSEIRTLADVLEHSRIRLQETLKELSQAKEWSEALLQSVIEGIITFDTTGKIIFFSEGAARITDVSPNEALGQPIDQLLKIVE